MCRLFVFPNEREMKTFFPVMGAAGDYAFIFQSRVTKEYIIHGNPVKLYSSYEFENEETIFYYSPHGYRLYEDKRLKYDDKKSMFIDMMQYSEICIVGTLSLIDDYLAEVYSYFLSLSNRNDYLPITISNNDELQDFDKRVSLLSYITTSPEFIKYRNKEFMNIETKKYFQAVHDMDINFDDIMLLYITERSVKNLNNYPYYLLNNTLATIGLFTLNESFTQIEKYYKQKYYKSHSINNEIYVKPTKKYEHYKDNLIEKGIYFNNIYQTFDNACRMEHEKFKETVIKYFKKLKKINKKETV